MLPVGPQDPDHLVRERAAGTLEYVMGKEVGARDVLQHGGIGALVALLTDSQAAVRDAAYQALIEAARFDSVRKELSISVGAAGALRPHAATPCLRLHVPTMCIMHLHHGLSCLLSAVTHNKRGARMPAAQPADLGRLALGGDCTSWPGLSTAACCHACAPTSACAAHLCLGAAAAYCFASAATCA